jgi:mRNA-degrading endonuclease RelE of RelBE toxin-antitoxin system
LGSPIWAFAFCAPLAYDLKMLTIIESPLFTELWPDYWSEEEHTKFTAFLAANPDAGDVVPGSGGCRKIRWSRYGSGKRGGVRIIYTTRLENGALVLLVIYAKSAKENIPAHLLKQIAEELGNAP